MSAWSWIPETTDKIPMVTSAFGDVFLQAADGGIWFLDLVDGAVTHEWRDVPALQRELDSAEGQDRFLLSDLVRHAARTGRTPGPTETLAFTVPPVLGGGLSTDNIRVVDLVAGHHSCARLHRDVKDLPAGTQIAGTTVGG